VLDRRGARAGRGLRRAAAALPEAGLVEHDPPRDLGFGPGGRAARAQRREGAARERRGDRRHDQRETVRALGTAARASPSACDRLQDRRTAALRRAQAAERAAIRRRDAARLRSLFLGHEGRVAARAPMPPRGGSPARAGSRSARWTPGSSGSCGRRRARTDPTNASRTMLFAPALAALGARTARCASALPAGILPECGLLRRLRQHARAPAPCPTACRWPASRATSRPRSSGRAACGPGSRRTPTAPVASCCCTRGASPCSRAPAAHDRGLRARGRRPTRSRQLFIAGRGDPVAARRARHPARRRRERALARSVPDSGGVVLVPAGVAGLGAPWWRSDVRGAAQRPHARHDARARGARRRFESLAFQRLDLVEAMARDAGARSARCRWTGRDAELAGSCRCRRTWLGVPVRRPRVVDTTALGARAAGGARDRLLAAGELDHARRLDRGSGRGAPPRGGQEVAAARGPGAVAGLKVPHPAPPISSKCRRHPGEVGAATASTCVRLKDGRRTHQLLRSVSLVGESRARATSSDDRRCAPIALDQERGLEPAGRTVDSSPGCSLASRRDRPLIRDDVITGLECEQLAGVPRQYAVDLGDTVVDT